VINTAAVVEHDVRLGAHVLVGPGCVIGGGAQVGESSYLGLGCRVRDHIRVGRSAIVGMGAVVVSDVGDGLTVAGVPARPLALTAARGARSHAESLPETLTMSAHGPEAGT
jgi:acetyltransferase EpsM